MGAMSLRMFSVAVLSSLVVAVVLGQDDGIRCGECIMEMHRFGGIIHAEAHVLADYLADNYCPTIEEEYLEDPIFQAEALLYLEHNWCDPHHHGEHCIETLQRHFIPMHVMVMEKYMIPMDIC